MQSVVLTIFTFLTLSSVWAKDNDLSTKLAFVADKSQSYSDRVEAILEMARRLDSDNFSDMDQRIQIKAQLLELSANTERSFARMSEAATEVMSVLANKYGDSSGALVIKDYLKDMPYQSAEKDLLIDRLTKYRDPMAVRYLHHEIHSELEKSRGAKSAPRIHHLMQSLEKATMHPELFFQSDNDSYSLISEIELYVNSVESDEKAYLDFDYFKLIASLLENGSEYLSETQKRFLTTRLVSFLLNENLKSDAAFAFARLWDKGIVQFELPEFIKEKLDQEKRCLVQNSGLKTSKSRPGVVADTLSSGILLLKVVPIVLGADFSTRETKRSRNLKEEKFRPDSDFFLRPEVISFLRLYKETWE